MSSSRPQIPSSSVADILGFGSLNCKSDSNHLALVWEHGQYTYAELRERALNLAGALRSFGLAEGDRVASMFYNRGEGIELYFACAFAGLTYVPVSFRLTAAEVAMILEDCRPQIMFIEKEFESLMAVVSSQCSVGKMVIPLDSDQPGQAYESFLHSATKPEMCGYTPIQQILYTSGTTGRPKGVAMRHRNIVWMAFQQTVLFEWFDHTATMLLTGPMYNTAAMNESSIPTLLVGGTLAIMPSRNWSAERMAELINHWNATHTLVFPSMFRPFLDADRKSKLPISSLKVIYTGGENCPPALMEEIRAHWPDIRLCLSYGSTESGMVTQLDDDDILHHPGSVGRPTPGQAVAILSPEGEQLLPNEVGEVWTRAESVVEGYWESPGLDAESVRNGWLKIGDLGRMDEDGYLYLVGRTKDLIISKGQNIYPAEVENALRSHPSVGEVSVVGVPDSEFGESVCAAIIIREGLEPKADNILEFVRGRLASYKKPKHIVFLTQFPRGLSGKVKKDELVNICLERLCK